MAKKRRPPVDKDHENFGLKLSQIRCAIEPFLSVERACQQVGPSIRYGGISVSDLSALENGQMSLSRLPVTTLQNLLKVYKCDLSEKVEILEDYRRIRTKQFEDELSNINDEIDDALGGIKDDE